MATLTFDTPESISKLLLMVEHGIITISQKTERLAFFETRIANYKFNRAHRPFWEQLFDDWCEDESPEGVRYFEDYWEVYRIKHTHIPKLRQLKQIQRILKTSPSILAMSDADMFLITSASDDFDKQFINNIEDANNALNA